MTPRSWNLDLFGQRPLTVNKVATMHRQQWATRTRDERRAWALLAQAEKVPPLGRIRIVATPLHKDRRSPQDVAACAPAVKAAIDGLVDAGVIPDDNAEHLDEIVFRAPWVCGADGLRLEIIGAAP
jgi:hypothetical protein